MRALEATPMDWEALKNRIERRKTEESHSTPADLAEVLPEYQNWPGTDDADLWINLLNKKQRERDFRRATDQAIMAVRQGKNSEPEAAKEQDEEELIHMFGALMFMAGMVAGAVMLFLIQVWG